MKILLTGSSGFLGRRLLEMLSKNKKIKTLCLTRSYQKETKKKNINYLKCDLKNINKVKNKICNFKPEILIHLAWDNIPNFSLSNSKQNENNSKRLINFVLDNTKIDNIIVSGSCFEIYPPNKSYRHFVSAKKNVLDYIKSKKIKKNFRYQWLRIFYVYGPGQRNGSLIPHLISSINKNSKLRIKTPKKKHDFIYIDDVCKFIINCLSIKIGSNIFELGSGKSTSILKIIKKIEKIKNKKILLFKPLKDSKNKIQKANLKLAKKKFNWKPKFSIDKGLNKTLKIHTLLN